MITPTTELTLPVDPHVLGSRWGSDRTPDLTRSVVARLLGARRQVRAQMWAARSEVIVRQLRKQRASAW